MAPGPSSCHGVSHQPFLSRPFLSVSLAVPSSTTGHPPSQRHVQAERKRQEQDWKQTSLFWLCHHQNTLISSHFSGRFCRLPGRLCPCFLLGKWNIHLIIHNNLQTPYNMSKIESKPPYFDYYTIKIRSFQFILVAVFVASLGIYAPVFFLVSETFILLDVCQLVCLWPSSAVGNHTTAMEWNYFWKNILISMAILVMQFLSPGIQNWWEFCKRMNQRNL